MNLFFLHLPAKKMRDERDEHMLVTVYKPQNTAEGSEFLDDAIRMNDQPLMYTRSPVAATCLVDGL